MKQSLLLSGALMLGSFGNKTFATPEISQLTLLSTLPTFGGIVPVGNVESGKQSVPKPAKETLGDRVSKTTLEWGVSY